MQIELTGRNLELTPAIEAYARKKLEKLPRFFDLIQRIECVLEKQKVGYQVENIVEVEHREPFVAHMTDDDLYACIDLAVDRTQRQLKDHKSKLRDNKHGQPTSGMEP